LKIVLGPIVHPERSGLQAGRAKPQDFALLILKFLEATATGEACVPVTRGPPKRKLALRAVVWVDFASESGFEALLAGEISFSAGAQTGYA
jgi:hypothetical protein